MISGRQAGSTTYPNEDLLAAVIIKNWDWSPLLRLDPTRYRRLRGAFPLCTCCAHYGLMTLCAHYGWVTLCGHLRAAWVFP